MSEKGKDEATFRINIAGNASQVSKDVASSARNAAKAIGEFEDEAKALSADLRRLKGNSDEVVEAKSKLKKRLDEIKGSVSSLTADLNKQGLSYKAAADAAKKYQETTGKLPNLRAGLAKVGGGVGSALGPLAGKLGKSLAPGMKKAGELFAPITKSVGTKLAPLGAKLGKWGGAAGKTFAKVGKAAKEDLASVLPSVGSLMGAVATAGALATAAVVAVGAAFIGATVAIAAFGLAAADARGKVMRQREALLGTAKDAGNLGDQIAQLAGKVPQGTAELNALAHSLNKTRLNGKSTVNALNAIAQVSGAVDDAAGAKIQELITRGDKFGRMGIGMFELDGTGLDFDEVAKAYAEGTKKSLDAARKELRFGIAPIEAGSAAIAKAAEKKFGKLNVANAFSLENAPKKFKETLQELSSGVDLGPISHALQDAFGQLAPNAPLGSAVKTFMTTFGGGLVEVGAKAIPLLLEGFKYMVGFGLKLTAIFIETKTAIADAFNLNGDDWAKQWHEAGKAVTLGLAKGILAYQTTVYDAVTEVGKGSIKAFKELMGIHSPSKVFADFGEYTTEGYAQGVQRGSRSASDAVQGMVDMPMAAAAPGGGSPIHVEVNIHGMPTDQAEKMKSPETEAMLTRVVRNSLAMQGL